MQPPPSSTRIGNTNIDMQVHLPQAAGWVELGWLSVLQADLLTPLQDPSPSESQQS